MATLYPDVQGLHPKARGLIRELEIVRELAETLPADYAVFHGVLWSAVFKGDQTFGEIDAVVLAPSGEMVLLEIKSGEVLFAKSGVFKRYNDGRVCNVNFQVKSQHGAMRARLREEGLEVGVQHFLLLPDMRVEAAGVGLPRERVIDCDQMAWLDGLLMEAAPADKPNPNLFARAKQFLLSEFVLAVDADARMDWIEREVRTLSEGLATWVPRLSSPQGLFLVNATAGSGKTQLALRLLQDAVVRGLRARYVCFNRPLADRVRVGTGGRVGEGVEVTTFHELAVDALRKHTDMPLDFSSSATFQRAEQVFCAATVDDASLDVLLIDEGQDFHPSWLDALLRQRKPCGRAYVLQDEAQHLYPREGGEVRAAGLDVAVEVVCQDNFRTPRKIVQAINALGLAGEHRVVSRSPVEGEFPQFHRWDEDGGLKQVEQVLSTLFAQGVSAEQIALLSFVGRERSLLLKREQLAGLGLRRFTGRFDDAQHPIWSDGVLLADTIHRFKGQAAPVVVLAEVDFARLDELARRRLFVGMSRAQLRLEVVLSGRAEQALFEVLRG